MVENLKKITDFAPEVRPTTWLNTKWKRGNRIFDSLTFETRSFVRVVCWAASLVCKKIIDKE